MKPVQIVVLFLLAAPSLSDDLAQRLTAYLSDRHPDEAALAQLIQSGKMDGFFSNEEIESIFDHLSEKYKGVVHKEVIGASFQGREIHAYRLRSSKDPSARKSKVLFTGLHHARELITANMVVKIFIETLHSLVHSTPRFSFWNFCDLIIIPVVNVDSHRLISEAFGTDRFDLVRDKRKNMNANYCREGGEVGQGVDLNRNYGFHYGEEVEDNDECGETFRGRNAFSEPETRAVRDFLTAEKGLASAMNFHSYGNMWIHPFNYLKLAHKFPDNTAQAVVNFYEEFGKEVKAVSESGYGNAIEMVNYSTDGEASDWMLGELGVVAFSPELGSLNPEAQDFFIPRHLIAPVIQENFKVIELFLEKNSFSPHDLTYGFDNNGVFWVSVDNRGLATIFDPLLAIPKTKQSAEFLNAVSRVQIEVRPAEFEEGRFEGDERQFVVAFDRINRLDRLKINFHFNDPRMARKSFNLKMDLKIQAGYNFSSFEVRHSGAAARRRFALLAAGMAAGLVVAMGTAALVKVARWMRRTGKEEGDAGKELNC